MSDSDDHPWAQHARAASLTPAIGPAESDTDDADEVSSSSEGEASSSGGNFVCVVCGYETDIETPQRKTENWCRGDCDDWSKFERKD